MRKIKNVQSEVLLIGPGDTLLLTFGEEYDLEACHLVANKIAENFPNNKIIVNREGLLIDVKIIKEEAVPFVTGLTTTDYMPPPTSWTTTSWDPERGYKEFKFDDYLY